jgi:hypothetical protein
MALEPKVWGPFYWFVLHTITLSYPLNPNEVTKKKYYEFIQNLPLFIPNPEIGDTFSKIINNYPVTPYLDSRPSFIKWMHFIHNKINLSLGKEEVSMDDAMISYYEHYKPKEVKQEEHRKSREKYVFLFFIMVVIGSGWYLYTF